MTHRAFNLILIAAYLVAFLIVLLDLFLFRKG